MKLRTARALAAGCLVGTLNATCVFVLSVVEDLPRVWPGTVSAFVLTFCATFLLLTRESR